VSQPLLSDECPPTWPTSARGEEVRVGVGVRVGAVEFKLYGVWWTGGEESDGGHFTGAGGRQH